MDDEDDSDTSQMTTQEIIARSREIDAEVEMMRAESTRLTILERNTALHTQFNTRVLRDQLRPPQIVGQVVEIFWEEAQQVGGGEGGVGADPGPQASITGVVLRVLGRVSFFLPMTGLVEASELKIGDMVALHERSLCILEKLPQECDHRVQVMELDERPTEHYSDIGGLDEQMRELIEAVVMPLNNKEIFDKLGIQSCKGVLMYGPPGTGKTLLARACAAETKSTFLKLAGPQLVQMYIGDGAKLVREAFELARKKQPTIIFIDELDAVGTKRFEGIWSGTREVQRTMLELLNQLDGFHPNSMIKVIAATNRIDVLDPALLRSGRFDRKIEFPYPNEESRLRILLIHTRKMNISKDVSFEEISKNTQGYSGAMLKAVCVEAGMIALRRGETEITHEDFVEAVPEVQGWKKTKLFYFS